METFRAPGSEPELQAVGDSLDPGLPIHKAAISFLLSIEMFRVPIRTRKADFGALCVREFRVKTETSRNPTPAFGHTAAH